MFNKKYVLLLSLLLLLLSVSSVCATDTDNITDFDNNCLSDVNCSNSLNNDLNNHTFNSNDVICDEDNIDCCGAIAFQSILKENGINITLEEANKAIHSVNGTTSMQGLIDGAKAYNLTAYPVKINASDLQPNFIVHMNTNGSGHWAVVHITDSNSCISDKCITLSIDEFNNYYDNNSVIITNNFDFSIDNLNVILLSKKECNDIIGTRVHIKLPRFDFKFHGVHINIKLGSIKIE